ncbi:DUF72 domain-containing protein [Flammeovirgaceae bacterium SG7u.111]|nr:DUF72 domain-containing protein [Flammeovirgaceae bacterium SG7u.132]WPO36096.1 DUF72 domain-containing protein [Flammeovirgaceae bacterium SG7u.111]
MKFGKLTDISDVDFTLPKDGKGINKLINPENNSSEILIGCPAWGCKEWKGKIYPDNSKSDEFLNHYSRHFQTIELNTTFYRTPDVQTIMNWKERSDDDFKFCPKVSREISHLRRLDNCVELTHQFCNAFIPLAEKLGSFFLQLPPNFTPREFSKLENFILNFPPGLGLAVEFRHPEWFSNQSAFENARNLLESQEMLMVITDVAGRRDVLHQNRTTDETMIRFVGNDLHPTDYERADEWVDKLEEWATMGMRRCYFFVHEPDDINCPEMAYYITKKISEKPNLKAKRVNLMPVMKQRSLF